MPLPNTNTTPFRGSPVLGSIPLYTKPPEGSKAISYVVKWADYNPVGGAAPVLILDPAAQQISTQQFSQIAAIFIDNTSNSRTTIGVYFEDTQTFIEVQPLSSGYYPVVTNNARCIVFDTLAGSGNETTTFTLLNEFIPPSNYSLVQHVSVDNITQASAVFTISGSVKPFPTTGKAQSFGNLTANGSTTLLSVAAPGKELFALTVRIELLQVGAGGQAAPQLTIASDLVGTVWQNTIFGDVGVKISPYGNLVEQQELQIPFQTLTFSYANFANVVALLYNINLWTKDI